eukprot:COSAG02_NODE_926_length_15856_cov_13.975566_19_plen_273_part_00
MVSSLDLFPTATALAGLTLPFDRVYDGRDMSDVLLKLDGKSKHTVLFFYGGAKPDGGGPGAARMGPWKAYWATGPGLGGCDWPTCQKVQYPEEAPLMFNVHIDPSESIPLFGKLANTSDPGPTDGLPVPQADIDAALKALVKAFAEEKATFTKGNLESIPELPGESCEGCTVAICCDGDPFHTHSKSPTCDCNGEPYYPSPSPPGPPAPSPTPPGPPAPIPTGCAKELEAACGPASGFQSPSKCLECTRDCAEEGECKDCKPKDRHAYCPGS